MSASDEVPSPALPLKPYDSDYVFNGPFLQFEKYRDGEFEHDERLFLTALTGRYKLKADGFHRLIAKFIMHLNDAVNAYSSRFETVEVEVPSFVSEFRSTKVLSNQIELSDVFYCDLKEEQLVLAFDISAIRYPKTESELLNAKRWLFAAISSLLILLKIKKPAKIEQLYDGLCKGRLGKISKVQALCMSNLLKVAIDFKKFEKIMKVKSDALQFAIFWMVLDCENYPSSNATHLFNFCFLNIAQNYGLVLFVQWAEFASSASWGLRWKRLLKIGENVDGFSKSIYHLSRFYKELLEKVDKDGEPKKLHDVRWRYCRLVDSDYFNYMGISANLRACLVFLFVEKLNFPSSKSYSEFVNSRKKRPGFQKLTDEEEDFLRKDQEHYHKKLLKESEMTPEVRCALDLPEKEETDSDSDY